MRIKLLGQKFVGGAMIDQRRGQWRPGVDQAGGVPGLFVFPEVGAETALSPWAGDRVADRREGTTRLSAGR